MGHQVLTSGIEVRGLRRYGVPSVNPSIKVGGLRRYGAPSVNLRYRSEGPEKVWGTKR